MKTSRFNKILITFWIIAGTVNLYSAIRREDILPMFGAISYFLTAIFIWYWPKRRVIYKRYTTWRDDPNNWSV